MLKLLYLGWFFLPIMHEYSYYDLALKKCHSNDTWSIHGLWPELNSSIWPQFCRPSLDFNLSLLDPIRTELNANWASCGGSVDEDVKFWKHEYLKHGTCTSFNETDFFNKTLNLFSSVQEKDLIDKFCRDKTTECLISFNLNFTLRSLISVV